MFFKCNIAWYTLLLREWLIGLVAKLRLTLCDPRDCNPPGSSAHGISQARVLEWVAISFSRSSSWPRHPTHISCIAGGFFTTEPPEKPVEGIYEMKTQKSPNRYSWIFFFSTVQFNELTWILLIVWLGLTDKIQDT